MPPTSSIAAPLLRIDIKNLTMGRRVIASGRSCLECRRRKIKCDRSLPCAYCVRSEIRCQYPADIGKPGHGSGPEHTMATRVETIELSLQSLERQVGQIKGLVTDGSREASRLQPVSRTSFADRPAKTTPTCVSRTSDPLLMFI